MKKLNALIIPTRGRGQLIEPRVLETISLSHSTDVFLSIDDSDTSDYRWAKGHGIEIVSGPNKSMSQALNRAAIQLSDSYDYLAFMGDDHVARTQGWDLKLIDILRKNGNTGFAYGDDLLAGQRLPTAVLVDSRIVSTLGFIAPTQLKHMYLDNFWLEIGKRAGCLHFVDDVILEHLHFSVGKSDKDVVYASTNTNIKNLRDRVNFFLYRTFRLSSDLKKVKALIESPS